MLAVAVRAARMRLPAFVSTLKFRIVAIVVATGVLSAWGTANLLLGVTQAELTRVLLANERDDRERTAGLLAGKVHTLRQALIEVARHSRGDAWRDARSMEQYLMSQAALNPLFETVCAARPDGAMFARVERGVPQRELPYIGDREYFKRALRVKQPVLSDPVMGRVKKIPLLIVAVPMLDGIEAIPQGMGGYGLLSLYANWSLTRELTLGARILNATDKRYELAQGYNTAPRQVQLTLDATWP